MTPRNPLTTPAWPEIPDGEAGYTDGDRSAARLERYKSQLAEASKRRSTFTEANHESRVAVEAAQIDVIKGAIERSRDSAKAIQTSATAIATLYTGVAGLVFSVGDDAPLPVRGVIPIVFLGGAIVWSTMFLAWLGRGLAVRPFPSGIDPVAIRVDRVNWLNGWVTASVLRKAWALRLATLWLAAGLAFLPAAFIPITRSGPEPAAALAAGVPQGVRPAVAADDATTATTTAFPPLPEDASQRMRDLRYAAQLDEASALRAEERSAESAPAATQSGFRVSEELIWLLALVVAVVSVTYVHHQARNGDLKQALDELEFKRGDDSVGYSRVEPVRSESETVAASTRAAPTRPPAARKRASAPTRTPPAKAATKRTPAKKAARRRA